MLLLLSHDRLVLIGLESLLFGLLLLSFSEVNIKNNIIRDDKMLVSNITMQLLQIEEMHSKNTEYILLLLFLG